MLTKQKRRWLCTRANVPFLSMEVNDQVKILPLTPLNFPLLTVCVFVTSSVGILIIMRANYTAHLTLTFIYFCTPVRIRKRVSLVATRNFIPKQ